MDSQGSLDYLMSMLRIEELIVRKPGSFYRGPIGSTVYIPRGFIARFKCTSWVSWMEQVCAASHYCSNVQDLDDATWRGSSAWRSLVYSEHG